MRPADQTPQVVVQPLERDGGAVFFGTAALAAAAVTGTAAYEAWAIATGRRTVTSYVRDGVNHHRAVALAATAFVCVLIGHFWR